jgi:ribosomal protein S18 acetylase RimI-like enzyme
VTLELRAASSLSTGELAALFTSAYEDYIVPMRLDEGAMRMVVRLFDIDLDAGLIALQDGEPVGVVNLGVRGDRGWIGGIGVVTRARRQGIARRLMEAVQEEARTRGVREISLEVIEANEAAHRLYVDLGYEMTRWLEIGSLDPEDGAESGEEEPWERAHARIRELRTAPEPWQRDDGTLRHYDDLRGLRTDTGGAALFRIQTDCRVMLVQFAGDEDDARSFLVALRRKGPVSLFNVPEGDPALAASAGLGGRTALRQREMVLPLA